MNQNSSKPKPWVKVARILSIVWVGVVGLISTLIFLFLSMAWLFSELTFTLGGGLTLLGLVVFIYGMYSLVTLEDDREVYLDDRSGGEDG